MPTISGLLAALISGGFAAGVVLLVATLSGADVSSVARSDWAGRLGVAVRSPRLPMQLAGAVIAAVVVLLLTHWIVAAVAAAALVVFWPALFGGQRAEQHQIARLDALVQWTESLRDTITARASLEQAIPATATTAPDLMRGPLLRLCGLLRARVPLDRALLALSADLNDASADKVIGCLILNTRQRGTGLSSVLTAMVASARAELDQRRQISAGRASMRRSVQLVVAITIGFAIFVAVFARAYVQPYASPAGQLALLVVVGLFATGFAWMRQLAGAAPAAPFLSQPDARLSAKDQRVITHLTCGANARADTASFGSRLRRSRGSSR